MSKVDVSRRPKWEKYVCDGCGIGFPKQRNLRWHWKRRDGKGCTNLDTFVDKWRHRK